MVESVTEYSPDPGITVIVVNWNRRDLLRAALESLLAQTGLSREPEIVVVDNGSVDGSTDMIAECFHSVRIIRNTSNRGFCAANNQAIGAARGELIALLNNDAVADPDWLAEMALVFVDHPEAGMAACKILRFSEPEKIDKAGHLIWPDGQNRGRGSGELDRGQYDREEETLWPDGCAAMYRQAMLREIGGFDEDFFAYGDDAELGFRARIAGWKCIYNPKAVVRHRRASTLGIASAQRVRMIERNRVLLAVKLFPWSLLWLNGYFYALRLVAGFLAARRGVGEAARFPGWPGKWRLACALFAGDFEALWLIPRMLRKRAAISRIRRLSPQETRRLVMNNRISLKELSTQA